MKFQVRLTAKAEEDVEIILAWYAEQQSPAAAERWFAQLLAAIDTLEQHPHRCELSAEGKDLGLEIRQRLIGKRQVKYRLLFMIEDRVINILRVWHGARDAMQPTDIEPPG